MSMRSLTGTIVSFIVRYVLYRHDISTIFMDNAPEHVSNYADGLTGRWRHQRNLDRFFRRAYHYFLGKGFSNVVLAKILDYL